MLGGCGRGGGATRPFEFPIRSYPLPIRRSAPGAWNPAHAKRSASAGGRPPSATMMAIRSAHASRRSSGTVSPVGLSPTAAGQAPTASTPAAQAALASFAPPYAAGSSPATRLPRSAAYRARARHCCWPAASASSAKTSSRTSRAQAPRQPCTPPSATTRGPPGAAAEAASRGRHARRRRADRARRPRRTAGALLRWWDGHDEGPPGAARGDCLWSTRCGITGRRVRRAQRTRLWLNAPTPQRQVVELLSEALPTTHQTAGAAVWQGEYSIPAAYAPRRRVLVGAPRARSAPCHTLGR